MNIYHLKVDILWIISCYIGKMMSVKIGKKTLVVDKSCCKERFPQYDHLQLFFLLELKTLQPCVYVIVLLLPLTSCWSCQTFQLFTAIVWTGCKQEAIKMQSGGKIPVSWLKAGMPCRTIGRSENPGDGGSNAVGIICSPRPPKSDGREIAPLPSPGSDGPAMQQAGSKKHGREEILGMYSFLGMHTNSPQEDVIHRHVVYI